MGFYNFIIMADSEDRETTVGGNRRARARFISVEPINFCILFIQGVNITLRILYVQHRLAERYNYTLPANEGNCSVTNMSDPIGQRIQSEMAVWDMWMKSVSVFLPILTGTILTASSDIYGRKPLLILASASHLVAATIFVSVAWFKLPLVLLIVAQAILGLFGDTAVPECVSLAYIGDVYEGKKRTFKFVILSFITYAGYGLGPIIVGTIFQETNNFVIGFGVGWICAVMNVLYTSIPGIVLETVYGKANNFKPKTVISNLFKNFVILFKTSVNGRRWRMCVLLCTNSVVILVDESVYSVATIYGLGRPFCWVPITVGIYNALLCFVPSGAAAIVMKPLLHFVNEYWLIHVGILSFMGQMVTTALAKRTVELVYVAITVGVMRTLPVTLTQVLLSVLVQDSEQGTLFAVISLTSSFSRLISPLLMNQLYAHAVTIGFPQLTFYTAAAILVMPMILNGILQIFKQEHTNDRDVSANQPLLNGDEDVDEHFDNDINTDDHTD